YNYLWLCVFNSQISFFDSFFSVNIGVLCSWDVAGKSCPDSFACIIRICKDYYPTSLIYFYKSIYKLFAKTKAICRYHFAVYCSFDIGYIIFSFYYYCLFYHRPKNSLAFLPVHLATFDSFIPLISAIFLATSIIFLGSFLIPL